MRKKIFLIIFSFFFMLPIYGQLTTAQLDSLFIKANAKLSTTLSSIELIEWNKEQIEVAKSLGYKKGIALGYLNIAAALRLKEEYQECQGYLHLAKKKAEESGDHYVLATAQMEFAQYYQKIGIAKLAIELSYQAIEGFKLVAETDKYATSGLVYAYGCLGYYLYVEGRPDEAFVQLKNAIALKPTPTDVVNIAYYQYAMATPNKDSAIYYYDRAVQLSRSEGFRNDQLQYANILTSYGTFLVNQYDYRNGIDTLQKALAVANTVNYKALIRNIHRTLARAYDEFDDKENSELHKLQVKKLEAELNKEAKSAISKTLSHLMDKNELMSGRITTAEKRFIVFGCIFGGVLILLFYILWRIRSDNIKKRQLLDRREQEVKVLQVKVNDAFEEVVHLAKQNAPSFYLRFQECYPHFERMLLERYPTLKNSELVLLAYIYINFHTKEIAAYTFKSIKTIQNRKHLLRKKMNVPKNEDFYIWLRSVFEQR